MPGSGLKRRFDSVGVAFIHRKGSRPDTALEIVISSRHIRPYVPTGNRYPKNHCRQIFFIRFRFLTCSLILFFV